MKRRRWLYLGQDMWLPHWAWFRVLEWNEAEQRWDRKQPDPQRGTVL